MTLFTRFGARRVMITSVVAAASVALVLSGCSGGGTTPAATTGASEAPESSVDPFAPEVDTVKAVQYKQTSAAPWFAAITAGYPEEYGINLTTDYGENSPAILTSLVGGSGDVGTVSAPSIIDAVNSGIDIVIVGEAFRDPPQSQMLEALPGSGIKSMKDLDGKTVGVVGLNSGQHNRLRYVMKQAGLDPEGPTFVNLTYGEMAANLENGTIDAGAFTGAVLKQARDKLKTVDVFDFGDGPLKEISSLQWVSTGAFAKANPNAIAAFQCAVVYKGEKLVMDDEDAYTNAMVNDVGFDPAAVKAITKVIYPAANDPKVMQLNAKIQYQVGLTPEEFDMAKVTIPLPTNCDKK